MIRIKPTYKRVQQHFLRVTTEKSRLQSLQKIVAELEKQVPGLQLQKASMSACNSQNTVR